MAHGKDHQIGTDGEADLARAFQIHQGPDSVVEMAYGKRFAYRGAGIDGLPATGRGNPPIVVWRAEHFRAEEQDVRLRPSFAMSRGSPPSAEVR